MLWIIFALGAALAWGLYGPILHQGQVQLGNPLRALLCVGVAYFLIGVLVPLLTLGLPTTATAAVIVAAFQSYGIQPGPLLFTNNSSMVWAIGAVCIIYAFRSGGLPTYVMPLVFAGAPLVNVLFSMVLHPPKQAPNPLLYVGFVLAAAGAGMVLYFKPQA